MGKILLSFAINSLIIFSVSIAVVMQPVKAGEAGLFEQQKISSHLLVNLFLDKLDQNELVLFEQAVSRNDLKPHQVSFVYNIIDDSLIIRLCFKLQKKILVPKFENYSVGEIVVETDKDGNVMQIKSHVCPADEE